MSTAERIPGVSEYGSVDPAPPSKESNVNLRKLFSMRITRCLRECVHCSLSETIALTKL